VTARVIRAAASARQLEAPTQLAPRHVRLTKGAGEEDRDGDGEACLARDRCYSEDGKVTMEGPFCGTCKNGFGKGESTGLCTKCPSEGKSWGLAFSSQIILFVVTAVLCIIQFMKDPRVISPTSAVVLRQFLNYIHLSTVVYPVATLSTFADNLFEALGGMQYLAGARSPISAAIGAECYLQYVAPDVESYKMWVVAGVCLVPFWVWFPWH